MIKEIELLIEKSLSFMLNDYLLTYKSKDFENRYSFPLQEPTPFGNGVIEDIYFPQIEELKDDEFFEMGLMWIGENSFGDGLFLSFREKDFGSIYYFEHDNRCFWKDELFYKMFSNLDEGIVEYLQKRRDGKIPKKEEEYESFYFVAGSFEEFLTVIEVLEY